MHTISRRALFLAFFMLAIGPAFLFYLLVLQQPVISLVRLGLAALTIPSFAIPGFFVFPRKVVFDKKRLLLIGLGTAVLALLGMQAISFFPEKTWLFFGRHNLTLKPLSEGFELRGLRTSIAPISYGDLDGVNGWNRTGNRLTPASSSPVPLSWTGWTGDSLRVDFSGVSGGFVEVSIDGRVQEYHFGEDGKGTSSLEERFDMPAWGRTLIFLTIWLTIFYAALLFHFSLLSHPDFTLGKPTPVIRAILIICAAIGTGLLLLGIYIPIHPQLAFPDRDSGFFLYSGRQILEGGIPYKGFWDHKGPLIYYLNALGLLLGRNTAAGVWMLEIVWILAALICLYVLLRDFAGELPAWLGVFICLAGLGSSLGGGNFTEEYGLLFSILCFYFFWLYLKHVSINWIFLCGLMGGFAFLLRPNGISAAIGIGVVLLAFSLSVRASRRSLYPLLMYSVGIAAPVALSAIYFFGRGAFSDMFSAVFLFNRGYIGALHWNLLEDFRRGLFSFPVLGFWMVAGLTSLLAELVISDPDSRRRRFVLAFVVGAAAELYVSNLSIAGYKHYYIAWLPYVAILAAFFGSSMIRLLGMVPQKWRVWAPGLLYISAAFLIAGSMSAAVNQLANYYPPRWLQSPPAWESGQRPLIRLREVVGTDSKLVMWGNEVAYNFILGADNPSRFPYQYPLMRSGYASGAMVDEFVSALQQNLPVIVDASAGNPDAIPLEPGRRAEFLAQGSNSEVYQYLQPLFRFVDINYRPSSSISRNWIVLLPKR